MKAISGEMNNRQARPQGNQVRPQGNQVRPIYSVRNPMGVQRPRGVQRLPYGGPPPPPGLENHRYPVPNMVPGMTTVPTGNGSMPNQITANSPVTSQDVARALSDADPGRVSQHTCLDARPGDAGELTITLKLSGKCSACMEIVSLLSPHLSQLSIPRVHIEHADQTSGFLDLFRYFNNVRTPATASASVATHQPQAMAQPGTSSANRGMTSQVRPRMPQQARPRMTPQAPPPPASYAQAASGVRRAGPPASLGQNKRFRPNSRGPVASCSYQNATNQVGNLQNNATNQVGKFNRDSNTDGWEYPHQPGRDNPFPMYGMSGDTSEFDHLNFDFMMSLSHKNCCTLCGNSDIDSATARALHLINVHGIPPYMFPHLCCFGCGQVFDAPATCTEHVRTRHHGRYDFQQKNWGVVHRCAEYMLVYFSGIARMFNLSGIKELAKAFLSKCAKSVCRYGTSATNPMKLFSLAYGFDTNLSGIYRKHYLSPDEVINSIQSRSESWQLLLTRAMLDLYKERTNGTEVSRYYMAQFSDPRTLVFLLSGFSLTPEALSALRRDVVSDWHDGLQGSSVPVVHQPAPAQVAHENQPPAIAPVVSDNQPAIAPVVVSDNQPSAIAPVVISDSQPALAPAVISVIQPAPAVSVSSVSQPAAAVATSVATSQSATAAALPVQPASAYSASALISNIQPAPAVSEPGTSSASDQVTPSSLEAAAVEQPSAYYCKSTAPEHQAISTFGVVNSNPLFYKQLDQSFSDESPEVDSPMDVQDILAPQGEETDGETVDDKVLDEALGTNSGTPGADTH